MSLCIQDPNFSGSYSLHEALLQACRDSFGGAGAYAFVSRNGAELLLEDYEFESMINRGEFRMVIGVDAVTNEAALAKLNDLDQRYENLSVNAFLHDSDNAGGGHRKGNQ